MIVSPVSAAPPGNKGTALTYIPDNAGWWLRLARPTNSLISESYAMIVGPVSAAPPGIKGTALMHTPVMPGGGFALPGIQNLQYQHFTA